MCLTVGLTPSRLPFPLLGSMWRFTSKFFEEINMGDIGDGRTQSSKTYKESHEELRECEFFNKLSSWKEESKREISNIVDYHNTKMEKTFRELFQEVCDLKEELSITTNERNHLIDTMDNLRSENRQLSEKLHLDQPLQDNFTKLLEEVCDLKDELCDLKEELSSTKIERNHLIDTMDNLRSKNRQLSEKLHLYRPLQDKDNTLPEQYDVGRHKICSENSDDQEEYVLNRSRPGEQQQDKYQLNDKDHSQNSTSNELNRREEISQEVDATALRQNQPQETVMEATPLCPSPKNSLENESSYGNLSMPHNGVQYENHVCPECNSVFSTYEKLRIHLKNYHAELDIDTLKSHTISIHKMEGNKLKCEQCNYTTASRGHLKQHINTIHNNIKNHVCGECGYAASTKSRLKIHIKAVHKNIRSHVCGECGYAASQKIHLKKHIEAVHEKVKVKNHV